MLAGFFRDEGAAKELRKGELLCEQGTRTRHSGLVEAGALRYVHLTDEGERHVVGYAFAGEFVGDYVSMRTGAPSRASVEAMCDSRVLTVAGERLEAFYRLDAAHERLGRHVAEHLLAVVYERLVEVYAAAPQQRYEALIARCPELLNLIPLKELASFLRIRPETLSRIRSRIR